MLKILRELKMKEFDINKYNYNFEMLGDALSPDPFCRFIRFENLFKQLRFITIEKVD